MQRLRASIRRHLAWLLLAGCDAPATTPAPGEPPAPATKADEAHSCATLSRDACMASPWCTLEHAGTADRREYRCRTATPPCEVGFAQSRFFGSGDEIPAADRQQQACRERPGCVFDPGGCYCHCRGYGHTTVEDGALAQGCNCACSGGAPPTCRAQ